MVHGKKRIPYWIDWRLTGLAGPDCDATVSFGLPFEPKDRQYGKYRCIMGGVENNKTNEHPTSMAMTEDRMPEEKSNRSFSETVARQLAPETRELWAPMVDYFNREGPEAVKTYLDAERERLESNVRNLLEEFRER